MAWTTTSFCIQIIGGLIGAQVAAVVVREHAFGFWWHTVVGLIAGALGGYFLQTYAATMVTGSGSLNQPRPADIFVLQAVAGAALGAIATMAIGFLLGLRPSGSR